jgi:hypothetical protein
MSIRHPDAAARGQTPVPAPRPVRAPARPTRPTAPEPVRVIRQRPDPNPVRLMLGVVGLASAAALTSAMLPSITPQAAASQDTSGVSGAAAQQPVQHVTQYVTLQPGQTAPPQSTVIVPPQPTPKVVTKVVTRTRQSGG